MRNVLQRLIAGELTEDEALTELRRIQLDELGGRAKLDLGRFMRRGVPEVVLAPGKAPAEAARLVITLALRQGQGLISRMTAEHRTALTAAAAAERMTLVDYSSSARVLREGFEGEPVDGKVGLLTAGTSDVPGNAIGNRTDHTYELAARLDHDVGRIATRFKAGIIWQTYDDVKLTDREWLEVGRLANPRPARASRAGRKGEARPRAKK